MHSVCPSVCPSVPLSLPSVTSFRQPLASRMYFATEGRISYGHLGRTNSCLFIYLFFLAIFCLLYYSILSVMKTSCARGDMICPAPLLPRGRPSASRAAEQTQRSSSFPSPFSRSPLHLPHALRPQWVKRPGELDL